MTYLRYPLFTARVSAKTVGFCSNTPAGPICKSSLTGKVTREENQIGRIWHRMYPLAIKNSKSEQPEYKYTSNPRYLELLTIFPDGSDLCEDFLDFLYSERSGFMWLW